MALAKALAKDLAKALAQALAKALVTHHRVRLYVNPLSHFGRPSSMEVSTRCSLQARGRSSLDGWDGRGGFVDFFLSG